MSIPYLVKINKYTLKTMCLCESMWFTIITTLNRMELNKHRMLQNHVFYKYIIPDDEEMGQGQKGWGWILCVSDFELYF